MDEDQRREARKYLVRAKAYRLIGILFALVGIGVFAMLYLRLSGSGQFLAAMMDPFLIGVVLFPFVPAFFLTMMGQMSEKKVVKIIEDAKAAEEAANVQRTDLFSRDNLKKKKK